MGRIRWLLPVGLLLAWAMVHCLPATPRAAVLAEGPPQPVAGVPGIAAPRSIEQLREAVAAVLEREQVPGVGIALVDREGLIWAGGVGVADRETGVPVTADTVFRVASITKSIVALGVARLVEQGRLSLRTPVSQLLGHLPIDNRWREQSPVTLGHALEHTAGFDDMRFNEWFTTDEAMSPEHALGINARSRRVRWRPGSRAAYSNVGYSVAGLAIERATGQPFDHWLQAEVLGSLGMDDASFVRTPERRAALATGYLAPDRAATFSPIAHRAAGALLASPAELARLVHFWLRRGDGYPAIVSPAMLDRVERSGTLELPLTDQSYGLGNYGDVGHPVRARGHDGGLPGFLSVYRYIPELGVGYVMLLNSTHSTRAYGEIRSLLFAYLARGRDLPPPPIAKPDPAQRELAGYYGFTNPRNALFGFLDRATVGWTAEPTADGLQLEPLLGVPVQLVATGPDGYRHPRHSGVSVRLAADSEGAPVLVAGWACAEPRSEWLARVQLWLLVITALLLQVSPLVGLGWTIQRLARRRGLAGAGLWLWPAVAGLMYGFIPLLLAEASARDALGQMEPTTVALCLVTVMLALASTFGFAAAVRQAVSDDRDSWWVRVIPSLTSTLAVGLTLWFGAHGIIGLRTWAW